MRSRAAVVEAARTLFLEQGYAGTTMDEIAAHAGLTKRTLYNIYADKEELFRQIVMVPIGYADEFVRTLRSGLTCDASSEADVRAALQDLGLRLATAIVRPQVVALRRLLIGEARAFPELTRTYYDHAPGQVISALRSWFAELTRAGALRAAGTRSAAEQFAYLVAGGALDRAMLTGVMPPRRHVTMRAREGVETFLARYGPAPRRGANAKRRGRVVRADRA